MRARARRAPRRCWRASCRRSRRRSAAARRCRRSPTACRPGSCRPWSRSRCCAAHCVVAVRARSRGSRYAIVVAVSTLDHRVPVRARPRHADVDDGGDGARCAGRRAVPQRRGARATAGRRHGRARQDRHAHARAGRKSSSVIPVDRRGGVGAAALRGEPRAGQRASAGRRGRAAAPGARAAARPQLWFRAHCRARARSASCSCATSPSATRALMDGGRRRRAARSNPRRSGCGRSGRPSSTSRVDGVPVGLLGVADPLKPEAWDVVQQLKARASRS